MYEDRWCLWESHGWKTFCVYLLVVADMFVVGWDLLVVVCAWLVGWGGRVVALLFGGLRVGYGECFGDVGA